MPQLKILVIVGLPASSKTYLGEKLSQETGAMFLDDVKDATVIDEAIAEGHTNLIVTHPFFCDEKIRQKFVEHMQGSYHGVEFEWIFFENDPAQCRENAKRRERAVEGTIRRFERIYTVPEGYKPIPVWRPCK